MIIREAAPYDIEKIKAVVKAAFYREGKDAQFNEWEFAEKVTRDPGYLKPLCFVAVKKGKVVGYVLFSKAKIGNCEGLALGPIAVEPEFQRSGIGKRLIETGIRRAKGLGYDWVALLGGDYYLKFGFEAAQPYGVILEENHPENAYVKINFLNENHCKQEISGQLRFCDAFYNEKGELL